MDLKILPSIVDYPEGIQITQDEWSLGFMYWQNVASENIQYYRSVNKVLTPISMTEENWMFHDTFYKKILRAQLRSRELERSSGGLKCVPDWSRFILHNQEARRISRYWVQPGSEERGEYTFDRTACEVQYPTRMRRLPTTHVLRHFFSQDEMSGCHNSLALHPYLRHSEYQHIHRMDDTYFRGNFRDVMYPHIEYITQRFNDCCGCAWEHCRCLPNITRLSAWRVDCRDLQEGEVCRIQCHYKQPPERGVATHIPLPSPV